MSKKDKIIIYKRNFYKMMLGGILMTPLFASVFFIKSIGCFELLSLFTNSWVFFLGFLLFADGFLGEEYEVKAKKID